MAKVRRFLVAAVLIIAATLVLVYAPATRSTTLAKVRLSAFPSYGKNSPFYLALRRGFYADAGVDFEIMPTFQESLGPLHAGRAEVAQELCSEIIRWIELGGAPFRIIAQRDAIFPVGTVSLPQSNIRTPADYQGKRWGHSIGASPERSVFRALAERTGFEPASVTIVNLPFDARIPALLRGQVDFVSAWYGSGYPTYSMAARKAGVTLHYIRWSDYGIDIYGQCFAARTEWLQRDPEAARGFLVATLRGIEEALRAPEAAIEAVIQMNPNLPLDRELLHRSWGQSRELLSDDYTRRNGLLAIDPNKLARTRDMAIPSAKVLLVRLFTNDYLPVR